MSGEPCNNCGKGHRAFPERCLVESLLGVLLGRGEEGPTVERARFLAANMDTDRLWDAIGPLLDAIDAGEYLAGDVADPYARWTPEATP